MFSYMLLGLLVLVLMGFFLGRSRSLAVAGGRESLLHSRPGYHGAFVAAWVGIPAFILALIWLLFQGTIIDELMWASLPNEVTSVLDGGQRDLLLATIKQASRGIVFGTPEPYLVEAADRYARWEALARWAMLVVVLALAVAALAVSYSRVGLQFRARQGFERIVTGLMIGCSVIAILTTLGIVVSLLFEALQFFQKQSMIGFFTGLEWNPQIALRQDQITAGGAFGAIPVFVGTLLISFVALAFAIPTGLYTAIYLTEYARPKFRAVVKPVVEILAGVPTIVYGFFAILIVAPAMRDAAASLGFDMAPNSALAAGLVMGIMLIPFISSLSDDALAAVPHAMRQGSYGLGATKAETITRVLLPAALPGIMGGVLLAVSRAIGETMIVVMAAGIIAKLTLNPFEPVTTVTVQIVTLLIGDTEFDNPKTLAAFSLGLVLFLVTLVLNVIALRIVRKYREKYE